jgi:hypothetical protein
VRVIDTTDRDAADVVLEILAMITSGSA